MSAKGKNSVCSCALMFICVILHSQTNTLDRLKKQLSGSPEPSVKKEIILKICEQNNSLASDSFLKYIQLGENILLKTQDIAFSNQLKIYRVNYLSKTGRASEAVVLSDILLNQVDFQKGEIKNRVLVEKTRALIRNNQSKEAIEVLFVLLQDAEKTKDTGMVIQAYVLLGWANMEVEKYTEAIKWLDKGYHYTQKEGYFTRYSALFNNMASCYNNINKTKEALRYVNQGLSYAIKGENLTNLANALNIRADIFIKIKNQSAAQKDLEDALLVRELIGDPYYMLSDMAQLSYFYASQGKHLKGIDLAAKGIKIAESGKQYQKLMYLYNALAENYKSNKENDKLAGTLYKIIALKDTIYQNNSGRAIVELEGKYEYQKNQNTIIQQGYAISKGRYILIGSIVLFLLSILIFILIYKNYQHLQRQKLEYILNEQKQLSKVAVLTAEEKERKRIAADLHDNMGAHAAAISSNVKYLKEGIFNRHELINNLEENAAGMVNHLNDTIWVLKNEHLYFTNLSDRFKLWLQRLLANYPDIRYHFNERIELNIELSPNKTLHLFMLLKESVNNAIKHSQCKDLSIHFVSGAYWEIIIEDNGVGFDAGASYSGNGLQNMQQRANDCGWNISWKSNEPKGTRVTLRVATTIN